jgi:hypothetical protein
MEGFRNNWGRGPENRQRPGKSPEPDNLEIVFTVPIFFDAGEMLAAFSAVCYRIFFSKKCGDIP